MNKVKLSKVHFIPPDLEPGILYVSEEFGVACHLCPCGCSNKIVTPIGTTDWSFTEEDGEPTLYPSVGNWQIPCKSHYWIIHGEIRWSYQWTEEQILAGRQFEEKRRQLYFNEVQSKRNKKSLFRYIFRWLFRTKK